jgi:hypothetical protein
MLEVDIVGNAARRIDAYINSKGKSKKKDKEVTMASGLLSKKSKMEESEDEMDLTSRIAEYVMQIRKTKEEVLNGRNK